LTSEHEAHVPVAIAASIVTSVLHGLHAAHEACDEQGRLLGLVHRDVSPQNVIVGSDGVPRVIDFGIAKAAGRANVTREGQVKGKAPYMAPEQIQGGAVNPRTDVYGAAVLLWELLVGARLFQAEGHTAILTHVLSQPVAPPSSRRPDVPPALDAIALRGLDRNQARRFSSAREMALELEKATRLATAEEIGSWVQSTAGASLAERRKKLAVVERDLNHRPADPEAPSAATREVGRNRDEPATVVATPGRASAGLLTRAWARARRLFTPQGGH